mmetsp:Transcript_17065/g.30997  ORF Transcript_17065/g.30997 Transcript_17065/m.30997 type:complete len:138 (-) Transcript_17065:237-650(-)|eukprot:CAMPEP_0201897036 /NCGR_PEP_ID=MMETSP0902-20130614/45809_1 /ASSEMBLY_ACC=CAM_ASM_000551 /TAXON_ID=420261 /ORGANISM="Thalassiosira antarctica, Strain CCMP982" /LENGTH=137 /DNA_ID=CAMNT_0048429775 /DNA_START=121 /DNA_END=534 /DNA_ORIENTATION=-
MSSESNYDPFGLGSSYFGSTSNGNRRRQELARRQRMMMEGVLCSWEEERRRRAKIETRKRAEEEMAGRREKKKKPSYRIVRGPDGKLYKVVAPTRNEREDVMKSRSDENLDMNSTAPDDSKENGEEEVFSTKKCDIA